MAIVAWLWNREQMNACMLHLHLSGLYRGVFRASRRAIVAMWLGTENIGGDACMLHLSQIQLRIIFGLELP